MIFKFTGTIRKTVEYTQQITFEVTGDDEYDAFDMVETQLDRYEKGLPCEIGAAINEKEWAEDDSKLTVDDDDWTAETEEEPEEEEDSEDA